MELVKKLLKEKRRLMESPNVDDILKSIFQGMFYIIYFWIFCLVFKTIINLLIFAFTMPYWYIAIVLSIASGVAYFIYNKCKYKLK